MQGWKGARGTAARLIVGVVAEGLTLQELLGSDLLAGLAPSDRARAQRLATATLRQIGPADRILKPFLGRTPPPEIHALLRLGTVEMLAEGAPAHAVVDELVALARVARQGGKPLAGLVNAVLRRVAETDPAALSKAEAQALPGWLRGRLMSAWGKRTTMAIEAAHARGASLDLTPRDGNAAALAERLGGEALPTGSVRLGTRAQISELPGFGEGEWWVQDAAAALPARVLSPRPGERVLDLCAAPGGKTLQLAAAGAEVTAVDISAPRMARLAENLERCGLRARMVVADALAFGEDAGFDAILVDAPCSATGTIRRHPDLPFVRQMPEVKGLVALQSAMLDHAAGLLRPGGRLVFATCSLLPDEGEKHVDALLARHEDLRADPAAVNLAGVEDAWRTGAAGLRLRPDDWPGRGGLDGFFVGAFVRAA